MNIEILPTLVDQFRETFEGGDGGRTWIVDGVAGSGVFGVIDGLSMEQAFAAPVAGAKSIAGHAEHLRFSLELTLKRLHGEDPPADWASSFNVPAASDENWGMLKRALRRAYDAVRGYVESRQSQPLTEWPAINVVGLAAITAHNAYHLGAIRQIAAVVKAR